MISMYPAIFYQEKDDRFSVVFPDLNHLSTFGNDLNDAMTMAIDCLAGYLHAEKINGNDLPEPTPLKDVDIHCEDSADDDYIYSFVNMVCVDVETYIRQHSPMVEKTLTIPVWLDDLAIERKVNLSQTLQKALISELQI